MIKKQEEQKKQSINSGGKLEIKKQNKNKEEKSLEKEPPTIPQQPEVKLKGKDSVLKDDKKDKKDKNKDKKGKDKEKNQPQQKEQPKQQVEKNKKQKKNGKQGKNQSKLKQKSKQKQSKDAKDKQSKNKNKLNQKNSKNDIQNETIQKIQKSQNRAKMTIEQLIQQYKDVASKMLFNNHGSDPEKQKQIEGFLSRLNQQKQKRHKKMQSLKKHKQQIEQSRIKEKGIKMQLRKQKKRQKLIDRIKSKLQSIEANANERKQDYQKFIQYVKERKQFVPRFKRYKQEYDQLLQAEAADRKQLLADLQKVYLPMNLQQIDQFEQHYMSQKAESQTYRQNKIRLQNQLLNQQNNKLQEKLWRGKCHETVEKQLQSLKIKKASDKQKLELRRQYGRSIQQNLHREEPNPKQNEKNGQQSEGSQQKEHTQVREKFFQGVSYGLVTENKAVPLSIQDKNNLGNNYLAQIRQQNSYRKSKTINNGQTRSKNASISQQIRGKSNTYKIRRKSNPYYPSEMNKRSLDFDNYQAIQYTLQKIDALTNQKKLQDQIIKYGECSDILQIQERKRRAGNIVVKQINQKLDFLNKL